jgi:transposase InsO family protein
VRKHPIRALSMWSGIEVRRSPYQAPRPNALCERFLGSLRREGLDHLIILNERQLWRVLGACVKYFNGARPHQGIGQQLPGGGAALIPAQGSGHIYAVLVLGGLHHDYRRAA